ncbi:MAG: hypothetical protein DMD91_34405 [Candidatus Rokuibacteriota bacterium]|nr:MAG: hypothetical protein DMD91_34405 [Candidatus Rokubacteria bacterium]
MAWGQGADVLTRSKTLRTSTSAARSKSLLGQSFTFVPVLSTPLSDALSEGRTLPTASGHLGRQ